MARPVIRPVAYGPTSDPFAGGGGIRQYLAAESAGFVALFNQATPQVHIKDPATPANNYLGDAAGKILVDRPTAGWRFNASGHLEQVSANLPRYTYDPITLENLGLFNEQARVNVVLWNRDLTNAAWTKTNVTAAKDQTGLDGVSNSASSITATSDGGTVLQAIALASSARYQSAYVQRISGTGTLEMTMDGGTTWTEITIEDGALTYATIPTQTLANPSVGFRIGTSGDSFLIDLVQNENGIYPTSPMITGAASFSRGAELIYNALSDIPWSATVGMIVATARSVAPNSMSRQVFQIDDGTNNERFVASLSSIGGGQFLIVDGGVNQANVLPGTVVPKKMTRIAVTWAANHAQAALDGTIGSADASVTLPTPTTFRIGAGLAGTGPVAGTIATLVYVPREAADDAELAKKSAFGWLGDDAAVNVLPTNAAIEYSDYAGTLTKTDLEAGVVRPIVFSGYEYATPGFRAHFNTSAQNLVAHLYNPGLVTGFKNGVGAIYADDVLLKTFNISDKVGMTYVSIDFDSAATRHIEIVMPYSMSTRFRGLTIPAGSSVSAPTTRLTLPRAVFIGDSRMQGFNASSAATLWAEILCRAKGWQHINLGYGSRQLVTGDGTVLGNANPDVAFALHDYNNRTVQTALATFQANYETFIGNFRAVKATTKLYVITSNWIGAAQDDLTLKIADYRQAASDALDALADANNILVDGLTLTTNSTASIPDGIHSNDAGAAEWATALGAVASV